MTTRQRRRLLVLRFHRRVNSRQVDVERGAHPARCSPDIAAALFDDAVDRGQPSPYLCQLFGGEKGSNRCAFTSGVIPTPVSATDKTR